VFTKIAPGAARQQKRAANSHHCEHQRPRRPISAEPLPRPAHQQSNRGKLIVDHLPPDAASLADKPPHVHEHRPVSGIRLKQINEPDDDDNADADSQQRPAIFHAMHDGGFRPECRERAQRKRVGAERHVRVIGLTSARVAMISADAAKGRVSD
jgi:hypothetical protein